MTVKEKKATLLIVEDDQHLLIGIRDILEMYDYEVMIAHDGRQALEVLNGMEPPDLIVSDIMMPHMDGIEFLKEVRKEPVWVRIPFIFLTAKGEKRDIQRGKSMGVDDYITKPFNPEDLTIAVKSRLERQEALNKDSDTRKESAVEEVKRQLVTMLNHEMRTPLTLIVAYADMLKEFDTTGMSNEEVMTFLKGVNSGAERIRRLIENFILVVELENGDAQNTLAWRSQKVENLDMVIKMAHDQILQDEHAHRVCNLHLPDDIPTIKADMTYLQVIIRELIDNAVKFSEDPVDLYVSQEDNHVCIKVVDQGRGIPKDEQEKIWKKFYQINREKNEDQGSGSGLTLIKGLAEIQGGYVDLESEEGVGSTFYVFMPILTD